ncbi:hypothetical protein OAT11_05420 [Nitrospinaceae bacterium]|nr:hypothetical protein [Nitrospinaceae bacterium]
MKQSKILSPRHVGIIVDNLDVMIKFYIGLGLTLRRRDYESGDFVNHLLGTPAGFEMETAKLILTNEEIPFAFQFNLELIKIIKPEKIASNTSPLPFDITSKSSGLLDLSFTVENLDTTIDFILMHRGSVVNTPMKAHAGFPAIHVYTKDPEGNILHLAENLRD